MRNFFKNLTICALISGGALFAWDGTYIYAAVGEATSPGGASAPINSEGSMHFEGERVLLSEKVTVAGETHFNCASCTFAGEVGEDGVWVGYIECPSFAGLPFPFVINIKGFYSNPAEGVADQAPDQLEGYFTLLFMRGMVAVQGKAELICTEFAQEAQRPSAIFK